MAAQAPATSSPSPPKSPPSLNAALLAGLARRYPEGYQRYVWGLAPRPHHLSWWGLLLSLMRESSVAPAGVRGAVPPPLTFDPSALREQSEAGESEPPPAGAPRLYVVAPPGHAKSTLFSQVFPCWYLGHAPDQTLLMLTSSTTMARTYHDVVSSVLADSLRHAAAFPEPECRPDPKRGWSTDGLYLQGTPALQKEPAFRIAGWGASVLGARAHGIILDDALTQEESESALVTDRAWSHLQMTIENRLHPGGWLLGVGTRWTADDLIGRARRAGWPVYRYPALGSYPWATPSLNAQTAGVVGVDGSALWPRRFDVDYLVAERRRIGGARFQTVWQGIPTGVGAGVFRSSEWFRALPREYATLARRHTTLMYVDTAWSEKKTADYTASCTVGYDPDDQQRRLYFTGWWRHRVNEDGLAGALADHIVAMRPGLVGVEIPAFKQEATMALVRSINQMLIGRHACAVVAVPVSTDKVVRARPHAAKAEGGLAFYDRAHPLWPVVEAELLGFPGVQHDDLVDSSSGAVTMALYGPDLLLRGQGTPGSGGRAIRFG